MTSPIQSSGIAPVRVTGINPANGAGAARATQSEQSEQSGFGKAIGDALATVSDMDRAVTDAAEQAAVGDLASVSDYMVAATEAQLATEITVAVRDRALSAFNDIMRMQI